MTTWLLIGLAVLWGAPLVASVAMVVRVIREDRAERRELEREVRALEAADGEQPMFPLPRMQEFGGPAGAIPFDPRVHGRADHLRI
jgi:hypothetical protein